MSKAFERLLRNRLTIPHTPFYRKYPYNGGASAASADDRGCVDTKLRFFCNRIPKSANSSVVINLAAVKTGQDIPSVEAKKLFTKPSQLKKSDVQALDDFFCFAFVRNPYTRVLSAYLDKIERRALAKNQTASFADFVESLRQGKLYSNAHWAPQSSLLLLPLERFDFIGKVESLQTDLPYVISRIKGQQAPEGDVQSMLANSTGASARLGQYYTKSLAAKIRELYREDFTAFGYEPEWSFPVALDP